MVLNNKYDKRLLKKQLESDTTSRTTISFYKYVFIKDPQALRDQLYENWYTMGCLGRIYLATEGINAQMTVPTDKYNEFIDFLFSIDEFNQVPIKKAVEDSSKSFYKLIIKVKNKIVADGIADPSFDASHVGKHLTAAEFNHAMDNENAIVIDVRNHYESEVGHFKNAITPDADTFKDELPLLLDILQNKKDNKVLLYCTGGIRCEKASAYLLHHGYNDVNQLHGGIIDYMHQVKAQGLENKFIGKNFVFDDRLGERITDDIIANCHQCGTPCDNHTNCANDDCHLLFIQCDTCKETMKGTCKQECLDIVNLPEETQKKIRKGKLKTDSHAVHHKTKHRLRPKPNQLA